MNFFYDVTELYSCYSIIISVEITKSIHTQDFLHNLKRNEKGANEIVCIKQVPDTMEVKVDPVTKRIIREGVPSIINPYDMYAIEEALRLKERFGGSVCAITMGPPQAETALREAIALGVDEAILVSDRAFGGSDTWATAYTLSRAIGKIGDATLIFCGREALDGSTGQVGPELAEFLEVPIVAYVSNIHSLDDSFLECDRLMEDHYETVNTLPAIVRD